MVFLTGHTTLLHSQLSFCENSYLSTMYSIHLLFYSTFFYLSTYYSFYILFYLSTFSPIFLFFLMLFIFILFSILSFYFLFYSLKLFLTSDTLTSVIWATTGGTWANLLKARTRMKSFRSVMSSSGSADMWLLWICSACRLEIYRGKNSTFDHFKF